MLLFKPIELTDKLTVEKYLKSKKSYLCSHCFVDLFIWKNYYNTQICVKDDFLFIKQVNHGKTIFTVPLGTGDFPNAIESLREYAQEINVPFEMAAVNETTKQEIETLLPSAFDFAEERDSEDYIYLSEDLITLAGKKLHSKRNFINRFTNTYDGRWQFENLSDDNVHEVFDFHLEWCENNTQHMDEESSMGETSAISSALKNFKELELKGGIIRLDGKIIAFTLGVRATDDMFILQVEKADSTIQGSYQMINQQFAEHNLKDVKYVNREEDLGIEGLRKAKLSYNPVMMGLNFTAYPK